MGRLSGMCGLAFIVSLSAASAAWGVPSNDEGNAFFESKIRPVLVESCYACHSAQPGAKIKGELRLDDKAGTLKAGASGKPVVVPGDVEKSLLVQAIRYKDEDLQMPPKKRLSAEAVKDFETWIKMGAPDPRQSSAVAAGPVAKLYKPAPPDSTEAKSHWSFQPVKAAQPPAVKASGWVKNDVDRFVLEKLEEKRMSPVRAAEKRVLIRRATFDLTGLPPTPADIDAFLADGAPDAFAKLIDRLLASPAYGERWGRHWLDVARYADTAGESADYPIPQAYKYRDYVIASFNHDKPYNQFLTEQIAGDLLPSTSEDQRKEQIIATGFIATARRFSVQPQSAMHLTIEDTLDTLGKSTLGLSLSCARCHDHKFDPIPTREYYGLYGIFSSTRFPYAGSETQKYQSDFVPLIPKDEADRVLTPYADKVAALSTEAKRIKKQVKEARDQATQDQLRKRERELEKEAERLASAAPQVENAYAVIDAEKTGNTHVQKRGEPGDQGDESPRGFLTVLGGQKLPSDYAGSGRLELAKWIVDPANPLTARVMVNRIWQHHFGRGLVRTPNDFGARGTPPTHPELLDYLAEKFVASGWSVKSMHRLMMLSATYQTSVAEDAKNEAADPTNDLLWQYERQRLDAESIRDAMLAISGKLDASTAGPHPFPPMNKWGFTQHAPFTAAYETNHRSVYLMTQRIRRQPYLATFDGADPNSSTGERLMSTTPLQALFMMNDKFVHESSGALAARLLSEAREESGQIEQGYRLVLGRPPLPEEVLASQSYLREFREKAEAEHFAKGDDAVKAALSSFCRVLLGSNEFLFVE